MRVYTHPPTYSTTMTLIKFFYGNGIPVEIPVQLFQACNDEETFDLAQYFSIIMQHGKIRKMPLI